MLLPQFTPEQGSLRVRAWRRLQALGSINVRTGCYVLPNTPECMEDMEWVRRELADEGCDVLLVDAELIDGLSDAQLRDQFNAAREAEYSDWLTRARKMWGTQRRRSRESIAEETDKLQRELSRIEARDCFGAPAREPAAALLASLKQLSETSATAETSHEETTVPELQNQTWVTRQGIRIDRIASAWLVRRHVDPTAKFRVVADQHYIPAPGEVRFDMFEAEFTHVGDRCTFEVLLERAALKDPALKRIGEIVHDIDLKDDRYERTETAGVKQLLAGLIANTDRDEERLERGCQMFDDLYRAMSTKSAR